MQTGHDPVKPEKNLRRRRKTGIEMRARNQPVREVFVIFKSLDRQKCEAQKNGRQHQRRNDFFPVFLRRLNRQRHGQAARQQNRRIERAVKNIGVPAAGGKGAEIKMAINDVGQKQSAKKQNFGREKSPHAEMRRFGLLLRVFKLFGDDWSFVQTCLRVRRTFIQRRIIVGFFGHDGRFSKIMFWRRRRRCPFQPGRVPRIWPGFFSIKQRPDQINQRQQITDAENRRARGGKDVVDLKFRRVIVNAARHAEIAQDKLREESQVESDEHDQRGELRRVFRDTFAR